FVLLAGISPTTQTIGSQNKEISLPYSAASPRPGTPPWPRRGYPPPRRWGPDAWRASPRALLRPSGRAKLVQCGVSLSFHNAIGGAMKAVVHKTTRVQHRPAPRSNERRSVTQHPRRRVLSLAAGAAALPAMSRMAWGQAYPTRPVRIIVGFAPGGSTD